MPLYSIGAWGKFYGPYGFGGGHAQGPNWYDYAIYQRRHTWHGLIYIRERYYNRRPRAVPWLASSHQKMRDGVSYWHSLTPSQRKVYHYYRYPERMTGFNRFLHYYLKDLPY